MTGYGSLYNCSQGIVTSLIRQPNKKELGKTVVLVDLDSYGLNGVNTRPMESCEGWGNGSEGGTIFRGVREG